MSLTNFTRKKILAFSLLVIVFALALAVSIYFTRKAEIQYRYTFIFPSADKGEFIIESRILPKSYISDVEYYVNEILLGPQTERTERLFSEDTKLLSCFQRGKVLYVNLSKGILNTSEKMLSIKDSVNLFEKNILKNFKSISKVEVYVEGNLAFSAQ